ncbi:uncharacterized protein B0P05DRAFT_586114 [Gilbertella persicaria]|uniref:uncharacterized protein n=1 Tax=Gilbertella persicaria TaxID=101096 RepID=UPI00222037A1|nr:uncharacterized protein B0P05DRAFT_586114 [Gilbertella persicaria]KAI8083376.1 hypothetical protein B0P05DRAFT_586114 [Gilbertella persicaria]
MSNQTETPKRFTRDEIMAMARYEYARQLSIYTKEQLNKGSTASRNTSSTAPPTSSARIISLL